MIRVDTVRIQEFRGIRDLTIDLNGKNFAVCGPNGTGKSGIVDALEFGLTGNISRLSGRGRGGLSVKEHAPHVNSRTKPEQAVVTLDVTICSSGRQVKIIRTVKAPRSPAVSPDEREVRETLRKVEQHPEFALSRREIIKYVLAEPGERAKEIQALLQLDKLETARSVLLRISNACGRERNAAEASRNTLGNRLIAALAIGELKQATLLAAVNEKRSFLGLAPVEKLEAGTSIREGLKDAEAAAQVKVPKIQAKRDLAVARTAIGLLSSEDAVRSREEAVAALSELRKNEARLTEVSRDAMLKTALELFDERSCPVCATPWDAAEFRALVAAQRQLLADAARNRQSVEAKLAPLSSALKVLSDAFAPLGPYAANLPVPADAAALGKLKKEIERRVEVLRKLLPIEQSVAALSEEIAEIASAVGFLDRLEASVDALPEPTARDAARDYLTVGQERLHLWRDAASKHSAAKSRAEAAEKAHAIFGETCDVELEAIYQQVEGEFRAFYRAINGDDEGAFEAQLTPSLGKLSFEVDFYGKGFFPPGAYHSEGHQDGMGLCLYLALMKHLLGARFTFAVLDDVLMSVDAGHRREVCSLLKAVFPKTQFVFTTHDGVWLNHMRHNKLVEGRNAITFRKWHVDHGPSEWKDTDVWAEIDELVSKNEIRAAAGQLRHYLEYVSAEWCGRLGGRVEYRADGKYELGDLLPAAIHALGDAFKKAKAAAQSWKDKEAGDLASEMHQRFSAAVQASGTEQWQINPAVHYNEWAAFQRRDFEPVVAAFKTLEREFACGRCGDPLYVVRAGSQKEAVRCACSRTSLNLKDKPRERATA